MSEYIKGFLDGIETSNNERRVLSILLILSIIVNLLQSIGAY